MLSRLLLVCPDDDHKLDVFSTLAVLVQPCCCSSTKTLKECGVQ
jgi:hypothetical protein